MSDVGQLPDDIAVQREGPCCLYVAFSPRTGIKLDAILVRDDRVAAY